MDTTEYIVMGAVALLIGIAAYMSWKSKQLKPADDAPPLEPQLMPDKGRDSLFPHMRTMQMPGDIRDRINSIQQIALNLKREQGDAAEKNDKMFEQLDSYVGDLQTIRNQYLELADVIDTQFQIVDFELQSKIEILRYHQKNRDRRLGLGQEIQKDKQQPTSQKLAGKGSV